MVGLLKNLSWEQCAQRNAFKMSQTQVNELTIGAKQALEGDKRRRGLIGGLHLAAGPSRQQCGKELKVIATRII